MGLLTREPKRIEAKPRPAPPEPTDVHLLYKTVDNLKATRFSSVIWIEGILANPKAFADLQHDHNLVPHESQNAEAWDDIVQLAIDVIAGTVKPSDVWYVRARKNRYPEWKGSVPNFITVEDLAHRIERYGEPDTGKWRVPLHPGMTTKGRAELLAYISEAREKYLKRNPPREALIDPRPSQGFRPDPNEKVFAH